MKGQIIKGQLQLLEHQEHSTWSLCLPCLLQLFLHQQKSLLHQLNHYQNHHILLQFQNLLQKLLAAQPALALASLPALPAFALSAWGQFGPGPAGSVLFQAVCMGLSILHAPCSR